MPRYEDFDGYVGAHVLYALGLPKQEALIIFRRRLEDGSWRRAGRDWVLRLAVLSTRNPDDGEIGELLCAFVEALIQEQAIPPDAMKHLVSLFPRSVWPEEQRRSLIDWFITRAESSCVPLAAQWINQWIPGFGHSQAELSIEMIEMLPLIDWLLHQEEASHPQLGIWDLGSLLRLLLEAEASSTLLERCVRRLIGGGHRLSLHTWGSELWSLVERLLRVGGREELAMSLLAECLFQFTPHMVPMFAPLAKSTAFPRTRVLLMRLLCSGKLHSQTCSALWAIVSAWPPDESLCKAFTAPGDFEPLFQGLRNGSTPSPGALPKEWPGPQRKWCHLLAKTYLCQTGDLPEPERYARLGQLIGYGPSLDGGIGDALREVLSDLTTDKTTNLICSLLTQPEDVDPSALRLGASVGAALMLLEETARERTTANKSVPTPSPVSAVSAEINAQQQRLPEEEEAGVTDAVAAGGLSRVEVSPSADTPAAVRGKEAQGNSIHMGTERTRVFLSYTRRDRRWRDRIQVHLKPIQHRVDLWDDSRLQAGDRWREEIQQAMAAAKVAVLLVSADFLASDFITTQELPKLLAQAKHEGARILPVIVSACRFTDDPELSQYAAVNDPKRPVHKLKGHNREEVFMKLAKSIEQILSQL